MDETTRPQRSEQPVVQRVTHILRQRIAQGVYPPGHLIPPERELAGELGVSRTSISRALSSLARDVIVEQKVGSGTRVMPDALLRLPPGTIALIHPINAVPLHPERALLLRGAEDTLTRLGCDFRSIPVALDEYQGPLGRAIRVSELPDLSSRYGAFLFIEVLDTPQTVEALHRQANLVVVANLEFELALTATWVDHAKVATSAVKVLAALGHRRISLLITSPERVFYGKTLQGYRRGLDAVGLAFDPALVVCSGQSTALDAYLAAKRFLTSVSPLPTAIIAGRDSHAEGIVRAAEELNLVIGRDLSLIGFDDVSWPGGSDFLTTFREPCYEMGVVAAEMLVERLYQQAPQIEQREIAAPLILRRSIGPAPDSPQSPMSVELLVQ